jgi:hypothetical protein
MLLRHPTTAQFLVEIGIRSQQPLPLANPPQNPHKPLGTSNKTYDGHALVKGLHRASQWALDAQAALLNNAFF